MIKILLTCLIFLLSEIAAAHAGPHGNDECILKVGGVTLRLNGYQFKGSNPDRHYCRHFPFLGQTIIKVDSIWADLNEMSVELQLLKRDSWLGILLNQEDAYAVILEKPRQYFSEQVVSIDSDIQSRDLYALKVRLYTKDGKVTEQQFNFLIGFPFAQIMVGIAVLLLLVLVFIVFSQWRKKRQLQ